MEIKELVAILEKNLASLSVFERDKEHKDFLDWEKRFHEQTKRIVDDKLKINTKNLINFRGKQIFVADRPVGQLKGFYSTTKTYKVLKNIIDLFVGSWKGARREALDSFNEIEKAGYLGMLKKYPPSKVGNPFFIDHKGYSFTNRYIRHTYSVGLFKDKMGNELNDNFIFMDIGSSYGIFSAVLKRDMPKTKHVLVDMPGQLVLAHYYLAQLFPDAKIAGFHEIAQVEKINKAFIDNYDFILVPTSMYEKISNSQNIVDVVTNFASLSEMSKTWFDAYINSAIFKTAKYFYTVNRYDGYPTYKDAITVLDYPVYNYKTIYMRTCPFLKYYYCSKWFFFSQRVSYPSEFFQFIGKNKNC